MPGGERAADQAAHARAGGHVDRDVVLLEPADHADVRDAARAAAAEGDADGRPWLLRGRGDRDEQAEHGDERLGHDPYAVPPEIRREVE